MPTSVLIRRSFAEIGGDLVAVRGKDFKLFDLFMHLRSDPRFEARVHFTPDSVWASDNPFLPFRDLGEPEYRPQDADVVFVGARSDWNAIGEARLQALRGAVVHRCGHFWGLRRGDVAFDFLRHPASRICTSRAIAAEFRRLGAPGEIHVVPNGIDFASLPAPAAPDDRKVDVAIVGMKRPDLARAVRRKLERFGRRIDLMDTFVTRREFLERVARARIGVFLPADGEGFHIPPLEAMALGTLVVCPDVRGNADYCRDGDTAIMPAMEAGALSDAAKRALSLGRAEREAFLARGRAEARAHDIATERAGVLAVIEAAAAARRR